MKGYGDADTLFDEKKFALSDDEKSWPAGAILYKVSKTPSAATLCLGNN